MSADSAAVAALAEFAAAAERLFPGDKAEQGKFVGAAFTGWQNGRAYYAAERAAAERWRAA